MVGSVTPKTVLSIVLFTAILPVSYLVVITYIYGADPFFASAGYFIGDYQYVVNKQVHNVGLMSSPQATTAVLSVVGFMDL